MPHHTDSERATLGLASRAATLEARGDGVDTRSQGERIRDGDILDGRYELLGPLGAGGMGAVYLGRRLSLGDTVAIKWLHAAHDSGEARRRFETEARAAAHVRHPNVVEVFDFGRLEDGRPYLVMEHLEGPTLADLLRAEAPLPVPRALEIFVAMCAAVEAGHRRGVLHRDLKPANVILALRDDGSEQVKVLDFGLARFDGGIEPGMTRPGSVLGTVEYMAPELVTAGDASPASDIWALGVMLYEMVTGQLPVTAATPMALMFRIAQGDWTPPEEVMPDLPEPVLAALRAAARQSPAERPASPERLARTASPRRRASFRPPADVSSTLGEDAQTVEMPTQTPGPRTALHEPRFDGQVAFEAERMRLREIVGEAGDGRGKIAVVRGPTGSGKTAMLEDLVRGLEGRGERALRARFFAYEGSRPPALTTFTSMLSDESPSRLALPDLDEGARWSLLEGLTDAFIALGSEPPLTLVLDDVQWASPFELQAIEHLRRGLGPRGVALVIAARDDAASTELDAWIGRLVGRREASVVDLPRFGPDDVRAYLRSCFGGLSIRREDLNRLSTTSGGNPLFVTQLVRALLAEGRIRRVEGSWLVAPLDQVKLPGEARELVRASIDALRPELRAALEVAAVIGERLRFETFARASELDEDVLDALVTEATRRGLLQDDDEPGLDDLRFTSPVVRAVLYDDLPRRRRVAMHRRVVAALEHLYADRLDGMAPALAYHYAAIGDGPRAFETGLAAAERAMREHDVGGARVALDRAEGALSLMTELDETTEAQVRLDLVFGTLGVQTGVRLDEALARLERVCEEGSPPRRLAASLELGRGALTRGEHARAVRALDRAVELATELGDDEARSRARLTRAVVRLRNGEMQEAARETDAVLRETPDTAPRTLRAAAERHRAWIGLKTGDFASAEAHARRALELARASGDLVATQLCVGTLAAVFGEGGDEERALPLQLRALELARRIGDRRREAIGLANTGEIAYRLERFHEALESFDEALSIFVELGDRACEGDCRVNVGRALLGAGQVAEAVDMLRRGRALCSDTGRVEYAAIAELHLGDAALALGDATTASEAFTSARDQLARIGSHLVWKAEVGLATAARLANDREAALGHARSAAERLQQQRSRLPPGGSADRFETAATGLYRLIDELEAG